MFRIFKSRKSKETSLTETQIKWNKLWELYAENSDEWDSPVFYLCNYLGGVNGEGHWGFIDNNRNDIKVYVPELKKILPDHLYDNFKRACEVFFSNKEDDVIDEICDLSDEYFYQHENEINQILQEYADKLEIYLILKEPANKMLVLFCTSLFRVFLLKYEFLFSDSNANGRLVTAPYCL